MLAREPEGPVQGVWDWALLAREAERAAARSVGLGDATISMAVPRMQFSALSAAAFPS